jgi:virginiamycin B lyase
MRGMRVGPASRFLSFGVGLALILAMADVAPVGAATVTNIWQAKIGSAGVNGTATVQMYQGGTASIALKVAKLKASTSLPVVLSKGTCGSVGSTLITFPAIKTTSAGAAARTTSLTAAQFAVVTKATAGTGKIAIRVGSTATGGVKCGLFAALAIQPYVAATIPTGPTSLGIALAPSGVWIVNFGDSSLSRIDPATNSVRQTLPLKRPESTLGPGWIAFGDGSLWVTAAAVDTSFNDLAGWVVRLDPTSGQVQATIAVGRMPRGIVDTPTGVWVTARNDNALARIDPATNQVTATIPVCTNPVGLTFGFSSVWVSCDDGSVARIDPATNGVVATIKTQTTGGDVVASDDAIWTTNAGQGAADGRVTRIDPATNAVVANVVVGSHPRGIAYAGGSLWIGLFDTPTVVRVSATSNAVLARITVAAPVLAIAADNHAVWAVQHDSGGRGTVTRINYSGVAQGPAAISVPSGTSAQQFEACNSRLVATTKSLANTPTDWPSQQLGLSKLADAVHEFRVCLEAIAFPATVTDSKALIYWSNMFEAVLRQMAVSATEDAANAYRPQYQDAVGEWGAALVLTADALGVVLNK